MIGENTENSEYQNVHYRVIILDAYPFVYYYLSVYTILLMAVKDIDLIPITVTITQPIAPTSLQTRELHRYDLVL